ncbi:MAG: sigma 54-interacting transcriptional regulator [Polyangiaceae bacterium]
MSQSRAGSSEQAGEQNAGLLETRTRQIQQVTAGALPERVPTLTLLGHPQASRIGDRAILAGLAAGEATAVSRGAPAFDSPEGGASRPLADPFLSRAPVIAFERVDGVVRVRSEREDAEIRVGGEVLREPRSIPEEELEDGVTIELSGRVALLLHLTDATAGRRAPRFDLVGDSDAIHRLRKDIVRLAATDMRVLLRGETGSGKELVARAIHAASGRASGPYVAVNMGAIQPSLATSALFGHVRGAFTGAVADHDGHIVAADSGTLFLDEIGDTDASVQAMLLRTLETSEVQRVGDRRTRKVDVRLLSATDADLESDVADGRFREPLLHRLAELTLWIPPLRARRDDIGRLVVHVLRELFDEGEQARLLDAEIGERPWLRAGTMARLARAPWTGNVRQLRNVVRQLAILCRDEAELTIAPDVERALGERASGPAAVSMTVDARTRDASPKDVGGIPLPQRRRRARHARARSPGSDRAGDPRRAGADGVAAGGGGGQARHRALVALCAARVNKRLVRVQDLTRRAGGGGAVTARRGCGAGGGGSPRVGARAQVAYSDVVEFRTRG